MQLLKAIFSPFFLIIVFFAAGMLLLILKKKETLSKWFLGIVLTCLFLLSFRPFSNYLLWGLEKKYAPLVNFDYLQDIHYIVILTAWDNDDPTVPYTSNIGYSSERRVLEAHRIYMHLPQTKIIISGDKISAQMMTKLMVLLGIQREKIIIDDRAANTRESAINVKKMVSGKPFVLVTSAIHLPRAMISFNGQGLKPVPAPADFLFGYYQKFSIPLDRPFSYYIPNVNSFMDSNSALYECLGISYYYIRSLGD